MRAEGLGGDTVERDASYGLNWIRTEEVLYAINEVAGRWGIASSKAIC